MTELSRIDLDGSGEEAPFDAAELGAMMREMRLAMQRDLKDVSQELRIRLNYLEAIENGRLDDLPGPAYTTGFLRAYSNYLGLDGDDVVGRFKKAGINMDKRTNLVLPSPLEEGRLPTGSVLLFAAFVAVLSYAGWYYVSTSDRSPSNEFGGIPQEFERAAIKGRAAGPPAGESRALAQSGIAELVGVDSGRTVAGDSGSSVGAPARRSAARTGSEIARAGQGVPSETAAPDEVDTLGTVDTSAPADNSGESAVAVVGREIPESTGHGASTVTAMTGDGNRQPPKPPSEPDRPVSATTQSKPPRQAVASATDAAANEPASPPSHNDTPARAAPVLETTVVADDAPAEPRERKAAAEIATAVQEEADTEPATDGSRIVIRATEDSWVEIRTVGGERMYSRLMREGDHHQMTSRPGLKMVTGNAGGLAIEVDGKAIPPLGRAGQILQDVAIDASSLLERVSGSP